MSVCPFCKAQVAQSTAPCPRCGKLAAEHPSIAGISGRTLSTDFDDDDPGELSLEASSVGASAGHGAGMPYDSGKGVTLDDDLFGDGDAAGPLELDVPAKPPAPSVPEPAVAPPPAPSSQPRLAPPPPASSSGRFAAAPAPSDAGGEPAVAAPAPAPPPPPTPHEQAAIRIANYPPVPEKVWEAPRYAVRVLLRQFELRQDLASLRRRRSPDVGLYERALEAHDRRMFSIGLAITGAALLLATVLFFMPVIKRFAFAPE